MIPCWLRVNRTEGKLDSPSESDGRNPVSVYLSGPFENDLRISPGVVRRESSFRCDPLRLPVTGGLVCVSDMHVPPDDSDLTLDLTYDLTLSSNPSFISLTPTNVRKVQLG